MNEAQMREYIDKAQLLIIRIMSLVEQLETVTSEAADLAKNMSVAVEKEIEHLNQTGQEDGNANPLV